jgi:hypothetical protein
VRDARVLKRVAPLDRHDAHAAHADAQQRRAQLGLELGAARLLLGVVVVVMLLLWWWWW